MRVYEIAKDLGISSKDLVTFLKKNGFEVASHMSVLPNGAAEVAQKFFNKKEAQPSTPKPTLHVVQEPSKNVQPKQSPHQHKDEVKLPPKVESTAVKHPEIQHSPKEQIVNSIEVPQQTYSVRFRDDQTQAVLKEAPIELVSEDIDLRGRVKGHEKIDKFLAKKPLGFGEGGFGGRRRRSRRRRSRSSVPEDVKAAPVTEIKIGKGLPLFEAADLMGKNSGDLILALLKKGMVCNRNNVLAPDIIKNLADYFGIKISVVVPVANENQATSVLEKDLKKSKHVISRWPIVVVMGHVDHGKTTLLDYIRKMKVAASEKGGITQHLGAYEVNSTHGKIVFLDTPGHEAFSYIRERGARVTDIAILVIAADDGIKPQTIEAINHAKAADVPIIVAINKIDKVQSASAIETVKRQLAQYELMPEDWGGKTIVVPISAKTGKGVDELLELIVLQSQMMDLKVDPSVPAKAFVLESKVEKGYGAVATVIAVEGTLHQGDYFICGNSAGKIRLLINSSGAKITSSGPSVPVQIVGFDSFASIGDWLTIVSQDVYLKAKSSKPTEQSAAFEVASQGSLQTVAKSGKLQNINLIIKTDTRGSKEALMGCIERLAKLSKEVKCPMYVLSTGVGDITENDIEFADNTQSIIVGLHVKTEKNAIILARQKNVTIINHHIIYHLVEDLEKLLQSKRVAEIVWAKVGEAVVKKVFDIKGVGVIAGCYLRDGILSRDCKVSCVRDGKVVGEGKITSLQRDKKTVKEIHAGYECGFMVDAFNDWQEGDTVLCYAQVKEKKQQ